MLRLGLHDLILHKIVSGVDKVVNFEDFLIPNIY